MYQMKASKVIWVVIILGIVAFLGREWYVLSLKGKQTALEAREIEKLSQKLVIDWASRAGARLNWLDGLGRTPPTIELERVLLSESPILIIGKIADISIHSETHCLVVLRGGDAKEWRSQIYSDRFYFELQYPKEKLRKLLKESGVVMEKSVNSEIAVLARVREVSASYTPSDSYRNPRVQTIAKGILVDIHPTRVENIPLNLEGIE